MATPRPASVDTGGHTNDDGYFGPESVTWRVAAHPALGLSAGCAGTIQMLYPQVMHMIDQASSFRDYPDLRAQRTGEFATTVFFGDRASADRAGEVLRRIHRSCVAIDPRSGEEYRADKPELLEWVFNSLTWALLRGTDVYGPSLSVEEQDRFVVEQHTMARMVGLDPEQQVRTRVEVDQYMQDVLPKLAYGYDTRWFKEITIPSTIPTSLGAGVKQLMQWGSVALYLPEHRELFGIRWNPIRQATTVGAVKLLLAPMAAKPINETIPQFREFVDENAFGARKRKVDPGPRGTADQTDAAQG
ncbi:MAG: DUF2236 domain-containing protein [Acidimicrobiia bacterium]|nr:DUF2236 domain-containing protein [Acidimicrobiia bacterium]